MFSINWTKKATKQLMKIVTVDRNRIVTAVATLKNLPAAQNVKALMNHEYGYRLRVGNYRVLFDVDSIVRIIEVQAIKKRDDNTY